MFQSPLKRWGAQPALCEQCWDFVGADSRHTDDDKCSIGWQIVQTILDHIEVTQGMARVPAGCGRCRSFPQCDRGPNVYEVDVLTDCLEPAEVYDAIDREIIVLIAGIILLGIAVFWASENE